MKKKLLVIFVCMLMIVPTTILIIPETLLVKAADEGITGDENNVGINKGSSSESSYQRNTGE